MKKLFSTKLIYLWSLVLFFVLGISSLSATIYPPILDNVSTNGKILTVRFSVYQTENIDSVQLWWAYGETNNFDDFHVLTTISINSYKDSVNQGDYLIYQFNYQLSDPLRPGAYTFYVQTINQSGQMYSSNFFVLRYSIPNEVMFTTTPGTEVHANTDYEYNAYAYSVYDSSLAVRYKIIIGEGATIDGVTGKFKWTATGSGDFEFLIRASLLNDDSIYAEQSWTVHVFECDFPSVAIVNIKDENGNPIQYGGFVLYKDSNLKDTTVGVYFKGGEIGGQGTFYIGDLDKGTYYLLVFPFNNEFEAEYYKDAYSISDATPIIVGCSDTVNISMTVKTTQNVFTRTVSGYVKKASDQSVVYPASVTFFGTDSISGRMITYKAFNQYDGKYSVELPNDYSYVAKAEAIRDTTPNYNELLPIYYDNVQDITEAKIINLADTTGDGSVTINFLLPERPNYDNSISGSVISDSTGAGIANATVIAYLIETTYNNKEDLFYGRTLNTDANGKFEYKNLVPGKYVILAYIDGREYIPGYYKEGEIAVASWWDGTRILVNETSYISDIKIILDDLFYSTEQGGVEGRITKGDGGNSKKIHNSPQGTEPVAGALVYAIDEWNRVKNYGFSDFDGNFEVSKLYKGQFTIQYDKVGYLKSSEKVTVSGSGLDKKDAILIPTNTTPVEEPIISNTDFQVYPIPAYKELNVCFTGSVGTANIIIINTLGQNVFNEQINAISGLNTIKISTINLLPGFYMLRIENSTFNYNMPVIIE